MNFFSTTHAKLLTPSASSYLGSRININLYFLCFIFFHTMLWFLGPVWARPSLPHDVLEGISWGLQWSLGYNKHPFLTAWLLAGATKIFNAIDWPAYLLAQVLNSLTYIMTFKLLKRLVPIQEAFVATLMLSGILFYNINSFNLTPDTLQSPIWVGLAYYFHKALTERRTRNWLITGGLAGLALLTKYQSLLILTSILLFCIFETHARKTFLQKGPYLAILAFLFVLSPHLYWLFQHDFITLSYATNVSSAYAHKIKWQNHLIAPLLLGFNLFAYTSPMLLLLWPFYRSPRLNLNPLSIPNKKFIFFIGYGPLLLTLLISGISGNLYPSRWGTPYFFMAGLTLLLLIRPIIRPKNLNAFYASVLILTLILWAIRIIPFINQKKSSSDAFLPNQAIALTIEKTWHQYYQEPLSYVAGSHYLVALTTPYLKDKPAPYFDWSSKESPHLNDEILKTKGGIFIWDVSKRFIWDEDSSTYATLPKNIHARFPTFNILEVKKFKPSCKNCAPIYVGIGIVTPQKQKNKL